VVMGYGCDITPGSYLNATRYDLVEAGKP
jgi:hypothetical protein